jgi:hypothetical protein
VGVQRRSPKPTAHLAATPGDPVYAGRVAAVHRHPPPAALSIETADLAIQPASCASETEGKMVEVVDPTEPCTSLWHENEAMGLGAAALADPRRPPMEPATSDERLVTDDAVQAPTVAGRVPSAACDGNADLERFPTA